MTQYIGLAVHKKKKNHFDRGDERRRKLVMESIIDPRSTILQFIQGYA